jgi:hypothetical protein
MSRYCKDKAIDSIVTKLVKTSNWTFKRKKKHGRITAPNGKFAVVPRTPSDFRVGMNFRCEILRIDQNLRGLI